MAYCLWCAIRRYSSATRLCGGLSMAYSSMVRREAMSSATRALRCLWHEVRGASGTGYVSLR
eukprot:377946-Prymnesium_polylepis.1